MFYGKTQLKSGWIKILCIPIIMALIIQCSESGVIDPTDTVSSIKFNSLTSSVDSVATGGGQAEIIAEIVDNSGEPVENVILSFTSNLGSITPVDTTDESGLGIGVYTSADTEGIDTVKVTATFNNKIITEDLELILDFKGILSLSGESQNLLADGTEEVNVTILYKDPSGSPLTNKVVNLYTDFGTVTESVTTDFFGRAVAVYKSPASAVDSTAYIYAVSAEISTKINISSPISELKNVEISDDKYKLSEKNTGVLAKSSSVNAIAASDTLEVHLTGIILAMSSSLDSISATGNTQTVITANLKTTAGDALTSKEIIFSTNFGSLITTSAITDPSGSASVILSSGTEIGVATVTASFLNLFSETVGVNFVKGGEESFKLSLSSNPTEILADGQSSSEITVILTNSLNNPISNETISFSTDLGRISSEAVTDEIGTAKVSIYSSRKNGIAKVRAEYQSISQTTQVSFTGVELNIAADPEKAVADGVFKSEITITLKDAAGVPIESEFVSLSASAGSFDNDSSVVSGYTDVNGEFIDSLKSIVDEIVTISGTGAGAESSSSVSFTRLITSLEAENASITADDSTMLTFRVYDIDGAGQEGLKIVFFTTLGNVNPAEALTDETGRAVTYLKSTIGGIAEITANITTDGVIAQPASTNVTISSTPPASIKLITDPSVVSVNGGEATLTAIVSDINGNPVPDQIVSYNIVQGPGGGETLDPAFAETNTSGSAVSVFKSGSIGSKAIKDVIIRASILEYDLYEEIELTIAGEPNEINTSSSPPPEDNNDGTFSLAIGSIVSDINGNPVVDNTLVHYSTVPPIGVIASPIETVEGKAQTSITYPIDQAGEAITILISSGEITDSLVISKLPTAGVAGFVDDIQINGPTKSSILADGEDASNFRVLVIDKSTSPVAGVTVTFSADPGNSGSGLTGVQTLEDGSQNPDWGVAVLSIKSISLSEDIYPELTITAGGVSKIYQENNVADSQIPLVFLGLELTMEAEKDTIDINETMNVTVVLKEATSNIALSNRTIRFGSELGLILNEDDTDDRGEIVLPFEAGDVSGMTAITATFGTGVSDTVNVFIKPHSTPISSIYMSADTSTIKVSNANGRHSTKVYARLIDAENNNAGSGVQVNLTTSLGTFAENGLTAITLQTDNDGKVSATLQSGTSSGIATIGAEVPSVLSVSQELVIIEAGNPNQLILSAASLGTLGDGGLIQLDIISIVRDLNGNSVAPNTLVSFSTQDNDGNPANDPVASIISLAETNEFGIAQTTLSYVASDVGKSIRLVAVSGGISTTLDIVLPNGQ